MNFLIEELFYCSFDYFCHRREASLSHSAASHFPPDQEPDAGFRDNGFVQLVSHMQIFLKTSWSEITEKSQRIIKTRRRADAQPEAAEGALAVFTQK